MGFLDSFRKMFSSQDQEDRVSLSRKVQASPNDPQARQKLGIFLMHHGEVVEGLEKTHAGGVRYPVPIYLRFQADFPKSYQELEKIWAESKK